jgi:hypothetical protein
MAMRSSEVVTSQLGQELLEDTEDLASESIIITCNCDL